MYKCCKPAEAQINLQHTHFCLEGSFAGIVFGCHVRTYATLPTAAAAVATTAWRADTLLARRKLQVPGPPNILMFMCCLAPARATKLVCGAHTQA
jgi:hypothetical protein